MSNKVDRREKQKMIGKYINLSASDRFVSEDTLRDAYIEYEHTRAPGTKRFVSLPDDLELGIVSTEHPDIAKAVSSILTRSLEDAKSSTGGYIPDEVVERVQTEIISPHGVANIWGQAGHRFVLSAPAGKNREIIASILVGRSKDTIFFFTGKYNNLKQSTMSSEVDLDLPDPESPEHKWFDRFAFPELERFKPQKFHHIANFVVEKEHRGKKYSRLLLDYILQYYSRDHIEKYGDEIIHSQHLLCGIGFWQIGDPPWLTKMEKLGFWLRLGAESFFTEKEWAPIPPVHRFGSKVDNLTYNKSYGLLERYEDTAAAKRNPGIHLLDRVPEVLALAKNPKAKLQYFQACFHFLDNSPRLRSSQ